MTEFWQITKSLLPCPQWPCLVFVGCLLGPTTVLAQQEREEPRVSAVSELAEAADAFEGKKVVVEGEVVDVKSYPEVLNGVSVYSFFLSDGTGRVRVVSPMAAFFATEDLVRVEGIYYGPRSGLLNDAHVDATEGTIEVLSASQSKMGKLLRPQPEEALSVPVSLVTTRLSRSAEIASIFSALFALLAASALVLRRRRFNIDLTLDLLNCNLLHEEGRLQLVLRATSTRSHPPQVRPEAVLKGPRLGRIKGRVCELNRDPGQRTAPLAVPVFSTLRLWLDFPLPKDATPDDVANSKLVLRDVLCRKRFVLRLQGCRTRLGTHDPSKKGG